MEIFLLFCIICVKKILALKYLFSKASTQIGLYYKLVAPGGGGGGGIVMVIFTSQMNGTTKKHDEYGPPGATM